MADMTYTVHKSMHGDGRDYEPGDTRELSEADAKELVEMGALALPGEDPKVRGAAIRHTFGQAETTGHLTTTNAFGGEIKPISAPASAEVVSAPRAVRQPRT